ncbi:methylamine utilization protein MauG [Henriciella algicola]|uniref:Methylamine utilization protein MauG n=2 Tax=Henriciella algicola TaxID=1608422 RepID=A0A399R8N8_9PROT|nr:methylamine utilization protein MauG [Henriciella algicola]
MRTVLRTSWSPMKSVIKIMLGISAYCLLVSFSGNSPMREEALRRAAIQAGVVPLEEIQIETDPDLVEIGAVLFESELLSFNGDTSCSTCHLDEFASADGLPNAVGTGGHGEGLKRLESGGDVVPRNTLALWGRGSKGFDTLFWDGKIKRTDNGIISQFGSSVPSNDDPLFVAVHLPFVEIREMVVRDSGVREDLEKEDVDSAAEIYSVLTQRIQEDIELGPAIAAANEVSVEALEFKHIAASVAAFIRERFSVRRTRFHDFVFNGGELSAEELEGGLIFYGKGRCSSCHTGSLLSDLKFHAMPFLQAGFGKNGFGVDYGRFNVTYDTTDLYKFRTPPLISVAKTGPWTHSGSMSSLQNVIVAHLDPLSAYDGSGRSARQRREDLARLARWIDTEALPEPLSGQEIESVVSFLETLNAGPADP